MSEVVELSFLVVAAIMRVSYQIGRGLARQGEDDLITIERSYLKHDTQINDGKLLRQTFTYLGIEYQEGDPQDIWGIGQPIDMQIKDSEGRPWLAFIKASNSQTYSVVRLDTGEPQNNIPYNLQLSENDPEQMLAQIMQNYGYVKVMRHLIQNEGYELIEKSEEQRPDGSRIVVLQKQDKNTKELHTVQLVFKPNEGQATISTDSRRSDGTHGVCPDIDATLKSIGIQKYNKWTSPAAKQALEEAQNRSSNSAKDDSRRLKQTPDQQARTAD